MINIILLIIAFATWNLHFFFFFFTALAIIRYRSNRYWILFISSLLVCIITLICPLFHLGIFTVPMLFILQVTIHCWNLLYAILKKTWKNDLVFILMEQIISLIMLRYLFFGGGPVELPQQLYNWLYTYIALQSLAIFIKIVIAFRLTRDEPVHRYYLLRRLLIRIDSSLGLNDLASIGVGGISAPTPDEMLKEKVVLYGKKILSTIKYQLSVDKNTKVDKQESDSDSDKKTR